MRTLKEQKKQTHQELAELLAKHLTFDLLVGWSDTRTETSGRS